MIVQIDFGTLFIIDSYQNISIFHKKKKKLGLNLTKPMKKTGNIHNTKISFQILFMTGHLQIVFESMFC